jgi:hypothetical protein
MDDVKVSLADLIDEWAGSLKGQFVIIYGPHRPPPNWSYMKAAQLEYSIITCQWCSKDIGSIHGKVVTFYNRPSIKLEPAELDFFDQLKRSIRESHHCVEDKYVQA